MKIRLFLLAACLLLLLDGCASARHKPNGKIKPGKPIPCPLHDC